MSRSPAYLYGESIFTSTHSRQGKLVARKLHIQRLYENVRDYYFMGELALENFLDHFEINKRIDKELLSFKNNYFRLTISARDREVMTQKSFVLSDLALDIFVRPSPEKPKSVKLRSTPSPFTEFKTKLKGGSYFQNLADKREALHAGFDDCLYRLNGKITEASTSNIIFVRGEEIHTPHAKDVFSGIGLEIFKKVHPNLLFKDVLYSEINSYDSCYLVNSVKLLTPVEMIDENIFTNIGYESMLENMIKEIESHK